MAKSKNTVVAKRYAQSLVELVNDGKIAFDVITNNLAIIDNTLNLSPDLDDFLNNPTNSLDNKKSTVDEVFKSEIDPLIKNFLKVLIDKNRFGAFKEIEMAYFDLVDEINNISRVLVVSAIELNQDNRLKIEQKLSEKLSKQVAINYEIDEEIIAGLVIKIGDNVIDKSLKYKLEDLEKKIK